jgi:hypothetical protein
MNFEDIRPGDWVKVVGLAGQVVWTSDHAILQLGAVTRIKEFCLFLPNTGKYVTVEYERERRPFQRTVSFSRDRIGDSGL